MTRGPSTSMKVYIVFLFVVCIVAMVKLIRVWRAAPPFRLSRQSGSPGYLRLLETSSISLKHWMVSTFLSWGILTSIGVYDVRDRFLDDKRIGSMVILFVIEDFSKALTMALLVVLILFLVRWHVVRRIDSLRGVTG